MIQPQLPLLTDTLLLWQMSFWLESDPCRLTYTALFDTFVDSFFLVSPKAPVA